MMTLLERWCVEHWGYKMPDYWWNGFTIGSVEHKEPEPELAEEQCTKLREFCREQGCKDAERVSCEHIAPCAKYVAYLINLLQEEKK